MSYDIPGLNTLCRSGYQSIIQADAFGAAWPKALLEPMKTLVVPPAAQRDENSVQLLSAWSAEKGLHCTMNIGMWRDSGRDEAAAWGILLSDVARHVVNALREQYGANSSDTLANIRKAFDRELDEPTSDVDGAFQSRHS
jgi:hypothetical protein